MHRNNNNNNNNKNASAGSGDLRDEVTMLRQMVKSQQQLIAKLSNNDSSTSTTFPTSSNNYNNNNEETRKLNDVIKLLMEERNQIREENESLKYELAVWQQEQEEQEANKPPPPPQASILPPSPSQQQLTMELTHEKMLAEQQVKIERDKRLGVEDSLRETLSENARLLEQVKKAQLITSTTSSLKDKQIHQLQAEIKKLKDEAVQREELVASLLSQIDQHQHQIVDNKVDNEPESKQLAAEEKNISFKPSSKNRRKNKDKSNKKDEKPTTPSTPSTPIPAAAAAAISIPVIPAIPEPITRKNQPETSGCNWEEVLHESLISLIKEANSMKVNAGDDVDDIVVQYVSEYLNDNITAHAASDAKIAEWIENIQAFLPDIGHLSTNRMKQFVQTLITKKREFQELITAHEAKATSERWDKVKQLTSLEKNEEHTNNNNNNNNNNNQDKAMKDAYRIFPSDPPELKYLADLFPDVMLFDLRNALNSCQGNLNNAAQKILSALENNLIITIDPRMAAMTQGLEQGPSQEIAEAVKHAVISRFGSSADPLREEDKDRKYQQYEKERIQHIVPHRTLPRIRFRDSVVVTHKGEKYIQEEVFPFRLELPRKTWDRDEYAMKAQLREESQASSESLELAKLSYSKDLERKPLQTREQSLQLFSKVGKSMVVTASTPLEQQSAFYCEVCQCGLRDSQSYLDHINGKKHNRNLGMNMRPVRSTVEEVKTRLQTHKPEEAEERGTKHKIEDLDARIEKLKQEEELAKQLKREKKRQKQESKNNSEFCDESLAEMGLPIGFGSSKK